MGNLTGRTGWRLRKAGQKRITQRRRNIPIKTGYHPINRFISGFSAGERPIIRRLMARYGFSRVRNSVNRLTRMYGSLDRFPDAGLVIRREIENPTPYRPPLHSKVVSK